MCIYRAKNTCAREIEHCDVIDDVRAHILNPGVTVVVGGLHRSFVDTHLHTYYSKANPAAQCCECMCVCANANSPVFLSCCRQ